MGLSQLHFAACGFRSCLMPNIASSDQIDLAESLVRILATHRHTTRLSDRCRRRHSRPQGGDNHDVNLAHKSLFFVWVSRLMDLIWVIKQSDSHVDIVAASQYPLDIFHVYRLRAVSIALFRLRTVWPRRRHLPGAHLAFCGINPLLGSIRKVIVVLMKRDGVDFLKESHADACRGRAPNRME